ncbi:porphobilinogen synthase [bacterium]|nr:porphobilinogen synthase [bacterium]
MYPTHRPRRLRKNPIVRSLIRETSVDKQRLIYPIFVAETSHRRTPVDAMPGISQFNLEGALEECVPLYEKGMRHFLIFGIPDRKDDLASSAYDENGVVQMTIRKMKQEIRDCVIFTDVCLCAYTSHGHCGVIKDGVICNDASVKLIARTALSHAQAGADFVAPSDMMDGRVGAIRQTLDENGLQDVGILSYAAKFSSAFYGPFREAAQSAPQFGDRKTHQMDPANRLEALKEMQTDIEEGADIIMVKPALSYLDIIREAKNRFLVPIAAYNVSGEYSMVKAAALRGWVDEKMVRDEILLSIRRAGADIIITYFAKDLALEEK